MDRFSQIDRELEQALAARLAGNEGRARVCARRADGIAARDSLTRRGIKLRSQNVIDTSHLLAVHPDHPAGLRPAALHLTVRVTGEFFLPVNADLIADARLLCERLLK